MREINTYKYIILYTHILIYNSQLHLLLDMSMVIADSDMVV